MAADPRSPSAAPTQFTLDDLDNGRDLLVPDEFGTVSFVDLAVYFHKLGPALLDLAEKALRDV